MNMTTISNSPVRRRPGPFHLLALVLALLSTGPAMAEELVQADPALTAREVVGIQLDALKALDTASPGKHMLQVWALAHPANKAFAGTLSRFAAMLSGPGYDGLIGHRRHEILAARAADEIIEFYVTVEAADGSTSAYVWVMHKVDTGEQAGCWMTAAVSPAVRLNRTA